MWIVACTTLCRTFRDNFYIMIFGLKFPLLLINFTGTLGHSIVLPFLVFLVTEFGGNPIVSGLLTATYHTFQYYDHLIYERHLE
jgi:hypothetical protein